MNNDEQGFLMFVKLILMSWVFVWSTAMAEPIGLDAPVSTKTQPCGIQS